MVATAFFVALALFSAASAAPEGRILGGNPVTVQNFPYAASLIYYYPNPQLYVQRCVGGIISSWHVLSSAYCFRDALLENMSVRAGSSNSLSGGFLTTVTTVIQHPDYQRSPRENDIAVLFLGSPLPISNSINAMYLPPQGFHIPQDTTFRVVSWGFESESGPQHESLQSIYLHKVNIEECKATYQDIDDVTIGDTVICAAQKGNVGTCFGDSGAPMAIDNVLMGVASYYHECGTDVYADVFTRVDRFTDWILGVATSTQRSGVPVRVAQ